MGITAGQPKYGCLVVCWQNTILVVVFNG